MMAAKVIAFDKPKWKCPSCAKWTRNEMGKRCAKCAKAASAKAMADLVDPALDTAA